MADWFSAGISDRLIMALAELGIKDPAPVQQTAIPAILRGENLVITAPTGTGKTLAYLLPILTKLAPDNDHVQAVVLAPTYELAHQIAAEAKRLKEAGGTDNRLQALVGGANIARQIDALKKKPQLIVGSLGRLVELANMKKLKLADVKYLVLDEFDRLTDDQNLALLADFIRFLPTNETGDISPSVQTLFFSATASPKALERIAALGAPRLLRVGGRMAMPDGLEHFVRYVPFREKIEALRRLTRSLKVQKGLVFVGRGSNAEWIRAKLVHDGLTVASLVGGQYKQQRQSAVAALKAGRVRLLLTTDLAARGLDIPGIDTVFNLDIPDTPHMYIHRAGRTARAGETGRVVTLADAREKAKLQKLANALNIRLAALKIKDEPKG